MRHSLISLATLFVAVLPVESQEVRPAAGAGAVAAAAMSPATVASRLQAIADEGVRSRIVETITAAGERGLPMGALVTKALEGVEKGAPPPRIEVAVRTMAGRLATASTALAPVISLAELEAGANALSAGVTPEVLREIRGAAGGRSTATALGIVAQLTARGIPTRMAGAAVAALVGGGASTPQLMALERNVKDDQAAGIAPSTALDLRLRQLMSALPPSIQVPVSAEEAGPQLQNSPPRTTPATPTTPRRRP